MTNCKFPRVAHFPQLSSKNGRRGCSPHSAPPSPLFMHGHHSILNCGKDTLWARCSQGVQGAGPLAEVARRQHPRDSTPLLKKILYLVGTWYIMLRNFITHFRLKLLSRPHRPTHTKNMVRHIKTAFWEQKNNKKTLRPPSAYQKRHDPPHILPPPSSKNNERSLTTQWLACIPIDHHVATPHSVYRTNLLIYSRYIKNHWTVWLCYTVVTVSR